MMPTEDSKLIYGILDEKIKLLERAERGVENVYSVTYSKEERHAIRRELHELRETFSLAQQHTENLKEHEKADKTRVPTVFTAVQAVETAMKLGFAIDRPTARYLARRFVSGSPEGGASEQDVRQWMQEKPRLIEANHTVRPESHKPKL